MATLFTGRLVFKIMFGLMKLRFTLLCKPTGSPRLYVRGSLAMGKEGLPTAEPLVESISIPLERIDPEHWEAFWTVDRQGAAVFEYHYFLEEAFLRLREEHEGRMLVIERDGPEYFHLVDAWCDPSDPVFAFRKAPFQTRQSVRLPEEDSTPGDFTHEFRVFAPSLASGESPGMLGNVALLGNWNTAHPLAMCRDGKDWVTRFSLPAAQIPPGGLEYKYVLLGKPGFIRYEAGINRRLPFTAAKDGRVLVTDNCFRSEAPLWRGAGVAVPVFSLRSYHSGGIGEFTDLKLFCDWAAGAGLRLLQLLPVNDTTATGTWRDSYPYAAISAFALNPVYLNLKQVGSLPASHPLERAYAAEQKRLNDLVEVDYEGVLSWKWEYLQALYFCQKEAFLADEQFQAFFDAQKHWLVPYGVFCYLRDLHGTADYARFGIFSVCHLRAVEAFAAPGQPQYEGIAFHYFVQYHLHLQLSAAARYARSRGIVLKGDIPIGIYRHSVDAWKNPEAFSLNMQSGAPPDDFATRGQNWGFPTYRWEVMEAVGFAWWKQRLRHLADYFDVIRFDHILGFFRIWQIPRRAVEGIMGHFQPAIALERRELESLLRGFSPDRYCMPYLTPALLRSAFGEDAGRVRGFFFEAEGNILLRFKKQWDSQRKISDFFCGDHRPFPDWWKAKLLALHAEVLLLPADEHGHYFHPRFRLMDTYSFQALEAHNQEILGRLHDDYFYHRQDAFWQQEALRKLPALKHATGMLVCGEDLGMVPRSVPEVMEALGILSLEVQRMPKESGREFTDLQTVPYLSVVTPGTHDMNPLRAWWKEDPAKTQRFFREVLGGTGKAPEACTPELTRQILDMHLRSPAMWSLIQLQDLFALYEPFLRDDPGEERINIPANPEHYWCYRMHVTLEELLREKDFGKLIRRMIEASGRDGEIDKDL